MKTQNKQYSGINLDNIGWVEPPLKAKTRDVWIQTPWGEMFTLYPKFNLKVMTGFVDNQYYAVDAETAVNNYDLLESMRFRNTTLYGGITKKGRKIWLPVYKQYPGEDDTKYKAIMKVIQKAQTAWVKLPNKSNYENIQTSPLKFEIEPETSKLRWLQDAFPGNFFIDSNDHPILKQHRFESFDMNNIEDLDD